MCRMKVRHAGRQVRELTIHEPEIVNAARVWARGVKEREFQIFEALRGETRSKSETSSTHMPGRLPPAFRRLIRDREHVA